MTPWFRMHHEARTDRKLASLDDAQFRVWFNLLCFASEQPDRGTVISDNDDYLAVEIASGDVALMNETLKRLETLHCVSQRFMPVSSGVSKRFICVSNFAKRQFHTVSRNDATSTERVRKFRERKRLGKTDRHLTERNGHETHETRNETGETPRTRADSDSDSENSTPLPPLPGEPSPNGETGGRKDDESGSGESVRVEPMPSAEELVEEALSLFGDSVANLVRVRASRIASDLSGRTDCYLAAMRAANRTHQPIQDFYGYTMKVARDYAVEGIPPEPVAVVPNPATVPGGPSLPTNVFRAAPGSRKRSAGTSASKPTPGKIS